MNTRSPSGNGGSPHEAVADTLRERIRSGELAPGDPIPSQNRLVTEFAVNRSAVRQAVEALTHEGLLHSRGRGAPPTVASPPPAQERPQIAGTQLAERLHAAFQAEHVTVDAFCLTTETLNNALAEPRRAVLEGEFAPRSVRFRIITPSEDAKLALPLHAEDPSDPRPLERLHEIQSTYRDSLRFQLGALQDQGYIREVTCEFRSVAVTPLQKVYLLNGSEALSGYYKPLKWEVQYRGEEIPIYDVGGLEALLFRSTAVSGQAPDQEAAFVEQSQKWFDSLWELLARPIAS
ncbi:winged helix-turn-helix domain-containing protein [Streptomyces sp. ODS28]|uniref:winged helix-turn-helix domain-containing protein n=1 Tax=Streptomyces sp. ODS28 TaxID=3136688 RepID=UPI0031ECA0D8